MQPSSVLIKTAKALEEIDKRTYKLAGRLRAILFMIDGQRTLGELLDQSGNMAGQLEEQLTELQAQGFIEEIAPETPDVAPEEAPDVVEKTQPIRPVAPPTNPVITASENAALKNTTSAPLPPKPVRVLEPFPVLKERLGKMLAETMGMRAMFLNSQLNSLQTQTELSAFIDDTARSMATTSGVKPAEQWREQARKLIGL